MRAPILVIGRRGQLATDLVEAARLEGDALVALGRPDLDLTDPSSIERALEGTQPAAVINAAAYTAVDRAESEREAAFALNAEGPRLLARACAGAGLPLVHVSTDQVFDGSKHGAYVEPDATNPLCLYGASKLAGERAVAEAGGPHLVARVSWLFGPSGTNFVTRMLDWAHARESVTIVSDQRGRPTYSPALACALLTLARRMAEGGPDAPRGLLHLAGGSVMTRYEQARLVAAEIAARGGPRLGVEPVLTRDFPTPATRPLNAELDVTLAATRYGIRVRPFAEDLATALDRIMAPAEAGAS